MSSFLFIQTTNCKFQQHSNREGLDHTLIHQISDARVSQFNHCDASHGEYRSRPPKASVSEKHAYTRVHFTVHRQMCRRLVNVGINLTQQEITFHYDKFTKALFFCTHC